MFSPTKARRVPNLADVRWDNYDPPLQRCQRQRKRFLENSRPILGRFPNVRKLVRWNIRCRLSHPSEREQKDSVQQKPGMHYVSFSRNIHRCRMNSTEPYNRIRLRIIQQKAHFLSRTRAHGCCFDAVDFRAYKNSCKMTGYAMGQVTRLDEYRKVCGPRSNRYRRRAMLRRRSIGGSLV